MARRTTPLDLYIEASRVFHWATMRHYQLWFTGQEKKRHRRSESVLKRLTRKGKLRAIRYDSKLIYNSRRVKDEFLVVPKVAHGLACTEGLVRMFRSDTNGLVIPERFFTKFGAVPEWGILYPNGKLLLFEYSTKYNFHYSNLMAGKLSAYERTLEKIEERFGAKAIVLFVIDEKRELVENYLEMKGITNEAFFFTDYESFLKVPIGRQLDAPIYIWMDGNSYPLRKNV